MHRGMLHCNAGNAGKLQNRPHKAQPNTYRTSYVATDTQTDIMLQHSEMGLQAENW